MSHRHDSVDTATLGDGPFLLVSEGVRDDERGRWGVVVAPTMPRVAALVSELAAAGARVDGGVVNLSGWSDAQVDRLSSLLELSATG